MASASLDQIPLSFQRSFNEFGILICHTSLRPHGFILYEHVALLVGRRNETPEGSPRRQLPAQMQPLLKTGDLGSAWLQAALPPPLAHRCRREPGHSSDGQPSRGFWRGYSSLLARHLCDLGQPPAPSPRVLSCWQGPGHPPGLSNQAVMGPGITRASHLALEVRRPEPLSCRGDPGPPLPGSRWASLSLSCPFSVVAS